MTRLLSVMVVVVAVMLAVVGVAVASVEMDVPVYKQGSPSPWYNDQLGTCSETIGSAGCAITSIAMVFKYYGVQTDPRDMNNWLKQNNGYVSGCLVDWPVAAGRSGGTVQWAGRINSADLNRINSELNNGYPVIAEVRLSGGQHFVVITGYSGLTYYINDPWYGDKSTINGRYGDPASAIYGIRLYHGTAADTPIPLSGDLNGNGTDSYGIFDPSTAGFTFNGKTVNFGTSTDLPVMGDWDHDGKDEIGVYRPDAGGGQSKFYLITRDWSSLSGPAGAADKTIPFGPYPTNIPIAGDWDGDGDDDIGGFYPGNNNFYLYILNLPSSSATPYAPHPSVQFGNTDDTPIIGDWDGDDDDDIGVFRAGATTNDFYLDLGLTGGQHEIGPYSLGDVSDEPLVGDWDDDGDDDIGVYRPGDNTFHPNYPPALSNGDVTPFSGDTSTTFDYYVTYADSDGDAPTTKYVYVDGSSHTMTKISGDYTSGATFKYSTKLSAGTHNYYFYFDDGHGHTVRLPTSGTISGPSVNTPPPSPLYVLVSESPDPVTSGGTSQVTVHVSTTGDTPVSGASISVSATGGSLSSTSGTTDANGDFKPTYTAPTVTTAQTYTISATASKTGYISGSGSDTITVNPIPLDVQGIDVSHWQGDINWADVHNAGYKFAFVKATEGTSFIDPKFETNMNNGEVAGMLPGAYHFARPDENNAADEAHHFVSKAGVYLKEGYLRPALDVERGATLGSEALSNWINEWMNTVESETGVEPILYVNSNYANNYLDQSVTNRDLWIAHWTYDPEASPDTGIWDVWAFWQYSNQSAVPGIAGNVDLDKFNGVESDLYTFVINSSSTLIPLSGNLYGTGDINGTFNSSTAEFTFNGKTVNFGTPTDLPVIGDWDYDGKDEIGVYRPDTGSSQSEFHLVTRDWSSLSGPAGAADKTIPFGYYPTNIPIAGDWDGDGDDDIGGFNPGNNKFYLYILDLGTESATSYRDVPFGISGDEPIIGDWDGDGDDDVGVYREFDSNYSNNLVFYFDLDLSGDHADLTPIPLGNNGDVAVIGDWDADGDDDVGLYRAGTFLIDPDFNVPHDLVYLDDGIVKVCVDLEWGGAISVIMHQGMNLIDNHDTGRLVQVAFYNDDSGTWDPVQGGDVSNQGSPVLDYTVGSNLIYTKTHPRDWKTGVLTDTYVEQWVSLEGQSVKVQYKFTHFGTDTYTFHDQEFPCAYINSRLYKLFTYTNSNPWTNDGVNELIIPQTDPGTPNTEFYPTEYWASFVNDLGFGLTLYSPDYTSKWAAHRFTINTQPSYLVTIDQFVIKPGTVEEATEYFIVGNYLDARNKIYSLEQPTEHQVHNINKGTDYNTIQAAINDANIGDEIHVDSGTYYENVVVNKQLILRGIDTGTGKPAVDAGGSGSTITLSANGITLEGFKATNSGDLSGDAGINVCSSNCLIVNNELFGNRISGIWQEDSSNNCISGNYIHETEGWAGIFLHNSSDNVISNNICENNKYRAIYLLTSSSNEVINNICKNDEVGGITILHSYNCIISNNTCENTSTGLYLSYSSDNTITNNNILENNNGIWLAAASNNRIYHNNLIDNIQNAYEYNSVNQWDSGSEGNYYSDYTGIDSNGDGIGDTPYQIPGGSSVDNFPLMAPYIPPHLYTVGQGAPTEAIKNHFIDAYNRNGGLPVLGNPATAVHKAWGYWVQDFPGASGYAGGIIMYNPYKDYAYYIHGAIWDRYYTLGGPNAETDIEFELGLPICDIVPHVHTHPPAVSSHGTQFRYQNFEGGALDLNVDTGAVLEIHGTIFAKWRELGYAAGDLGLVTSDEQEAVISAIGTEGRVSDFEGGHIHWHRNGALANTAFETHGVIDAVYCSEDGSGGWLGFPMSDEYVNPSGYAQSDFEGGYITTTDGVNYEAFVYATNPPTNLKQFKSDSTTEIPVGCTTNGRTLIFKGTVSDPDGDMVKLQVELRRLDEYGGQFDETKGGLKDSDFVASGSEAVAYAIELIDADYHWRARVVDEHGDSSEWQEFGGNLISEADFTVINTLPSGTINVVLLGYVDDATQHWTYRTNYNAPVFRRGVDNPLFMLTLDGQIPSNYECLYEIYSPNGASPIGSKGSSSFCCWDWTDINGNPLNKDQIPIGIYTVNGYLVNKNNPEDRKIIGFDEFYVIFDFDRSKESFVCWTQDYSYCEGCPNFEFNLNNTKIWKRAVENASGSVTVIEAVGKISDLARNIDGNMVYHHSCDKETKVFGSDGYDNDFDGEIDEGWLIFKEENWNHDYEFTEGKAYYETRECDYLWHIIPYHCAKHIKWVGDNGVVSGPKTAAKIAHYYDNMEMIKRDFDPENRIPRQHSLGVCDDYAMLTVGYLRAIGVPSRPVIGEGKTPTKYVCHEWLQWYENGKWHHLDTDNITNKSTWADSKYNALYYHSEQSVIFDQVGVRRDDMLPDVDEDPSDIADEYNGHAAVHSLTTSETPDNKTVCNYEIINTPIFKPGENSTVKINITNSANESKTVIVVVVLIPYLGPYRTPSLAYAESDKEITIAANSTVTEDFNLEVVGFTSPGDYNLTVYEVVNNNATLALTTATEVLAKYTITTEMPDNITYKQPFTFNVTIRNIVTAPIHNISVELDTHYHFNTTEPWEKEILALDAGENYTFTWPLTPIDYGDLRVDVTVYTSDAGSETRIVDISVLQTPKLWITAQVPEKVNKSDDFILNATIFNSGDIPSDSVTLNLTTPENVTVNRTSAELGIIEAHENKTCSFRISQNESRDFMIILNATALNVTATGYAFITISQVPISYFTYEPQNPVVNQPVTFNASNSTDPDGIITEYEWHFGDGNVTNTTEPIITHSYASTGDYTVNLTVTDDDGATNSTSKIITVTNLCGNVAPCPDCDGTVDMGDVILLLNNVSYPENPRYVLCNDWAGDCRCTGVRDMGDVILLLNNVSYPEVSLYALDCCG